MSTSKRHATNGAAKGRKRAHRSWTAEVFTWREGKTWLAAWRRFDIVSQGRNEREAVSRLSGSIAAQAVTDAASGKLKTFGTCLKPSAALLREWSKADRLAHARPKGA